VKPRSDSGNGKPKARNSARGDFVPILRGSDTGRSSWEAQRKLEIGHCRAMGNLRVKQKSSLAEIPKARKVRL